MVKRAAKTRTEVPTLGEMRVHPDAVLRGQIKGACGCQTWFEAREQSDENGTYLRLYGLSDAKPSKKSTGPQPSALSVHPDPDPLVAP